MRASRLAVGRLTRGALPRLRGRLGRNRGASAIGRATQPLTANRKRQTGNRRGFVLWEMLLGLAIFCVGAIALTAALQQALDTVILIHDESEVRQDLESIMAESSVNKLQAGKMAIFMADHRIQYEREVSSLPAKNWKGQPVASLWKVTVRATWLARNRVRTSEAQEFFFQP
jgi:Tfp pilus assembly protein PilV